MGRPGKRPGSRKGFLRRAQGVAMARRLLGPAWEHVRFPLLDHASAWKVVCRDRSPASYVLASHPCWGLECERQLEALEKRLGTLHDGERPRVVARDATWCGVAGFRQLLVMGSAVPHDAVLGLPLDFFDGRCAPL